MNSYGEEISRAINKILIRDELNTEMVHTINLALNINKMADEPFPWANLTLLSCECVGQAYETALSGAIGMELFAWAADIFDDIQDQDNDELPWRKLSDANAINLAVCLLMLSYEAVSNIPDIHLSKKVSSILNRAGIIAINGQFREFQYDCWEKITLDQYFELISHKSGSLTSCACRVGAIMANGSEEIIELLDQFGTNLGIMSQIRNDLNDFLNFKSKKDFINNKKTLPYVYLLSIFQKQPQRLKDLTQLQGKRLRNLEDEGREYLKQIAIDEGVAHYCKVMYEVFRQRAYEIIMAIPVPKNAKKKLIRLVEEDV